MFKVILSLLGIPLLFGCAHSATHGTIAMKISDQTAHVSVHGLNAGQNVTLFHNKCTKGGGGRGGNFSGFCTKEKIATGTVTQVLNEHYSVVEFPSGTKFEEGDFVEAE